MLKAMHGVWSTIGVLTLVTTPLYSQSRATTADLAGRVLDASLAVVGDAALTVVSKSLSVQRTATTDQEGRFLIAALPPGLYDVTVERRGFTTQRSEDVMLALGARLEVEFVLQAAGVAESITVVAPPPVVDLRRTAVSSVISQTQIENLPINGRDFISFSVLGPGVTPDRTPQQGAAATSGLTFAGQRARSNNITVDGLDNNESGNGGVRATFSQEAVQEFQVLASSASAEFGKASGGIVNIVTKTGSSRLAGVGFAFLRDDALNARDYFERFDAAGRALNLPKAPYRRHQFGATLGGPLVPKRAFYFLSFERLDAKANNFVTVGDTEQVMVSGTPIGTAVEILRRAGFPVETGNVPYAVRSNQFLGRVDHRLRLSDLVSVRFNWANGLNENIEPWGGQVARSRGALLDNRDDMVAASYTSVVTRHIVNELRFQAAFRDQSVLSLDPACNGPCDGDDEGGPTVEVSGVASVGRQRFTPQPKQVMRYQLVDVVSYARGKHYAKAGVDASRVHTTGSLPAHFGGRYIFSALPAISGLVAAPVTAIQALALELPAAYVQGYGNSLIEYAVKDLSLFAQDDWTIAKDLTLKVGVRYQTQFWPSRSYSARGLTAFRIPRDNDNLAPRLAMAWSPDRGSSIHASYGVFYDNNLTSLLGVANVLSGTADGVRTQVVRLPASVSAWRAPGRQVPESFAGPFPSLVVLPDPALKTPFARHLAVGVNRALPARFALSVNALVVRGHNQLGTLDYNPLVPGLGANRRPEDDVVAGVPVAGSSTSVLQYTSFGETWYRGLTVALERPLFRGVQALASYTLSKAEDTSTDFQSAAIPENTGKGRDRRNPTGLPIDFDPRRERGPSVQDQRHRLVLSGVYAAPARTTVAAIVTIGAGRPYTALAGADVNGDGNGGAFPTDRARRVPSDPESSVTRNDQTLPVQATVDVRVGRRFRFLGRSTVDALLEAFNLFNRTNFVEVNNIFGAGTFPDQPLATYGQFQKADSPRQLQLGLRLNF